jgi:hypothetical protein
MAQHIYNATMEVDGNINLGSDFGGWQLIDIKTSVNEGNSLKIGVYSRTVDGATEYALVNKGTSTGGDWIDNVAQPMGFSLDTHESIVFAKVFNKEHKKFEITMVGHSKGGAEAIANAIATDRECITFNPAIPNLGAYGLTEKAKSYDNSRMTHYVVKGEALNNIFGENSVGTTAYLNQQHITPWYCIGGVRTGVDVYNAIQNHLMPAVIAGLKERR